MSDNGSIFLIPGSLRKKMAAGYGSSNIPLYGEIKASWLMTEVTRMRWLVFQTVPLHLWSHHLLILSCAWNTSLWIIKFVEVLYAPLRRPFTWYTSPKSTPSFRGDRDQILVRSHRSVNTEVMYIHYTMCNRGRSFCFRPPDSRVRGTETKGPSPYFVLS